MFKLVSFVTDPCIRAEVRAHIPTASLNLKNYLLHHFLDTILFPLEFRIKQVTVFFFEIFDIVQNSVLNLESLGRRLFLPTVKIADISRNELKFIINLKQIKQIFNVVVVHIDHFHRLVEIGKPPFTQHVVVQFILIIIASQSIDTLHFSQDCLSL